MGQRDSERALVGVDGDVIVMAAETFQKRCHHIVERIMEEIIEVVSSNLQDVPVQETRF